MSLRGMVQVMVVLSHQRPFSPLEMMGVGVADFLQGVEFPGLSNLDLRDEVVFGVLPL